jgi:hypothetical protein
MATTPIPDPVPTPAPVSGSPATYYILRARTTTMGDGPYVGLASDGAHAVVPEAIQARRFASLADAEAYSGAMGETFGDFEIEVRTAS